MTTPTREQVIERSRIDFECYFLESRRSKGANRAPTFMRHEQDGTYIDDHTQRHWWTWQQAVNAGRAQGLREAKEATKREFCDWEKLPTNALDVMNELGNFGPTVNAAHREVKGYMLDDEGDGVSRYWSSDDLRNIANGCNDVAAWLDQRAAIEQLRAQPTS